MCWNAVWQLAVVAAAGLHTVPCPCATDSLHHRLEFTPKHVTCPSFVTTVAWFPRTLLAELLALPDWTAVKASVTRMLALGMLRQLVPFGKRPFLPCCFWLRLWARVEAVAAGQLVCMSDIAQQPEGCQSCRLPTTPCPAPAALAAEGAGRRYSVAPADGGRSQSGLELCVNVRGVHFFRRRCAQCALCIACSACGAARDYCWHA